MPKQLLLTKKDAETIFKQFFSAKTVKEKNIIWDKLVPYANKYPELYRYYWQKQIDKRRITHDENGKVQTLKGKTKTR